MSHNAHVIIHLGLGGYKCSPNSEQDKGSMTSEQFECGINNARMKDDKINKTSASWR